MVLSPRDGGTPLAPHGGDANCASPSSPAAENAAATATAACNSHQHRNKGPPRPVVFLRQSTQRALRLIPAYQRLSFYRMATGDGKEKAWRQARQWFTLPVLGHVRTENVLLLLTLVAVIAGTVIGLACNPIMRSGRMLTQRQLIYLKFPGELFLRMLKMLIVPLVIASNISAIASLNAKAARITLSYLAVPVTPAPPPVSSLRHEQKINIGDSFLDMFRNMIPMNLVRAMFEKTVTNTTRVKRRLAKSAPNFANAVKNNESKIGNGGQHVGNVDHGLDNSFVEGNTTIVMEEIIREQLVNGTNILGLITFSIMFGFAVHSLRYAVTVMTALLVHGCVVLPLLLYLFTRRNPLRFAGNMLQALMCALGTASSTATLPCTIRCLESGNGIDARVTRFMLPLGTTVNMDGTALFQAIATVYISQQVGEPLELTEMIMVGLTSLMASMASTSMPSAGLITIVMVLSTVGLPQDKIAILLPVDWFLDRFRTMVNVFGNSVGAAILSEVCSSWLRDCEAMPCIALGIKMVQQRAAAAAAAASSAGPGKTNLDKAKACAIAAVGESSAVVAEAERKRNAAADTSPVMTHRAIVESPRYHRESRRSTCIWDQDVEANRDNGGLPSPEHEMYSFAGGLTGIDFQAHELERGVGNDEPLQQYDPPSRQNSPPRRPMATHSRHPQPQPPMPPAVRIIGAAAARQLHHGGCNDVNALERAAGAALSPMHTNSFDDAQLERPSQWPNGSRAWSPPAPGASPASAGAGALRRRSTTAANGGPPTVHSSVGRLQQFEEQLQWPRGTPPPFRAPPAPPPNSRRSNGNTPASSRRQRPRGTFPQPQQQQQQRDDRASNEYRPQFEPPEICMIDDETIYLKL